MNLRIETRNEYAIEYLEQMIERYSKITGTNGNFIRGREHHKTIEQRFYDELIEYYNKLQRYGKSIEICGDNRNSYSKTDKDATFMRVKSDYMGNDQLLPAYNMQIGVCDEYIAVIDAKQYASDVDCFVPLMEKFKASYGKYPEYPVADAGYGSYNNYLFCEKNGINKYMKFTTYAGYKFIFHSKILLCNTIVPRRRIFAKCAILFPDEAPEGEDVFLRFAGERVIPTV